MVKLLRTSLLGLLVYLSLPTLALAHPGDSTHSFLAGALHPLGGTDHVLAMLAVGLLAGSSTARLRWALPASFMTVMIIGAALGSNGVAVPFVEVAIALSLICFGAALVWKQTLRSPLLLAATAVFALFHGHAHGTEMDLDVSAVLYGAGFVLATALLHACGVLLAIGMTRLALQPTLAKLGGSAIAAAGFISLGLVLAAPM